MSLSTLFYHHTLNLLIMDCINYVKFVTFLLILLSLYRYNMSKKPWRFMMEEIGREVLWNVGLTGRLITYALAIVVMYFFIAGIIKRYKMWKIGKPSQIDFKKTLGKRIGYFISNGIFHKSILRESFPGIMHFLLFWGFLFLFLGTATIVI